MGRVVQYYDGNWKQETLTCACGWRGVYADASTELFAELIQVDCPRCDARLFLVSLPTFEQVEHAAASGHPEAVNDLANVQARKLRAQRRAAGELRDASKLPDLGAGSLRFEGDVERGSGEDYLVIRCKDVEVWRELVCYEDWPRFNALRALLRARYGQQFEAFVPTEAARGWLYGDDISAAMGKRMMEEST